MYQVQKMLLKWTLFGSGAAWRCCMNQIYYLQFYTLCYLSTSGC